VKLLSLVILIWDGDSMKIFIVIISLGLGYMFYRKNFSFKTKDFRLRRDKLDQINYEYEYDERGD
jgi:hypothetical protein